mgnify:FL=1
MIVSRKSIDVLDDSFRAREGHHYIRFTRHGNRMVIQCGDGNVEWDSEQDDDPQLTLAAVVNMLLECRLNRRKP